MKKQKLNIKKFIPLNKKVFLNLKEAIIKGDLKPGEKLVEGNIARKMNISRTTLWRRMKKYNIKRR